MITNAQLMEKLIEAKDNLKISELVVTLENKLPYKLSVKYVNKNSQLETAILQYNSIDDQATPENIHKFAEIFLNS
jgi:hypothetical protein